MKTAQWLSQQYSSGGPNCVIVRLSQLANTPSRGAGKIFSRRGLITGFSTVVAKTISRGSNSGEMSIFINSETMRKTLFYEKVNTKISNFKIQGCLAPPYPLPTPMTATPFIIYEHTAHLKPCAQSNIFFSLSANLSLCTASSFALERTAAEVIPGASQPLIPTYMLWVALSGSYRSSIVVIASSKVTVSASSIRVLFC